MISQYWKDQIPARPLSIQVNNQDGTAMDLSAYTDIEVVMVGTNNDIVDLSGSSLNTTGKGVGKFVFSWPTTRSLFDQAGDYLLQLKLGGTGRLDFTTTHPIRVKELGRVQKGNVYYR
jgi:hypothetical protein